MNSNRYTHRNIHSIIIYKSQDTEATQVPIDRWMDKEDMVYVYIRKQLSHKKEWIFAICSNVDGPVGQYA